jgi:hypothetical protein
MIAAPAPPSSPRPPPRPARNHASETEAFALLRREMAKKLKMEGHTMSDTRTHFLNNMPKSARRSGKLPHTRFIIALTRLGLGLQAEDMNILTSSLDPEGTGTVSVQEFVQEAHNHRHRNRPAHGAHLATPRARLAHTTWRTPRPAPPRAVAAVGAVAGTPRRAVASARVSRQPTVSEVVSQTSWVPPPEYGVWSQRSDYLMKGRGCMASVSTDVRVGAAVHVGLDFDSMGFKVVEDPYYVQAHRASSGRELREHAPEKWLSKHHPSGWSTSQPARAVPAHRTGETVAAHHMARQAARFHPEASLTSLGSPRRTQAFGTFQRGALGGYVGGGGGNGQAH